jgi:hypothetical protein
MSSIVFRNTKRGLLDRTLDLTTGVVYVELVTTIPTDPLLTQRSQLVLAAGGNYARQTVLNSGDSRTFTNTAAGVFWTFANPTWTGLTTDGTATIKGMAVIRQVGGSPAGSDVPICYNQLSSAYTPNGANFTVVIPSAAGIIEIP